MPRSILSGLLAVGLVLPIPIPALTQSYQELPPTARNARSLAPRRASLTAASDALGEALAESSTFAERLSAALTDSAVVLIPQAVSLVGPAAVRTFLSSVPTAPRTMRWRTVHTTVSQDARHGYTLARGSFSADLGDGMGERPGHFLIYWRRADDDWKVAAFAFTSRAEADQKIPDGDSRKPPMRARANGPADFRAELFERDSAFSSYSSAHGLGRAFAAYAAPQAAAMAGRDTIYFGPDAVEAAFTLPEGDQVHWTPLFADAAVYGDLGYTVGDAVFELRSAGQTAYTKYLTVWQRQADGEWKWVADLGNGRPAP